jgi:hypothetical protein
MTDAIGPLLYKFQPFNHETLVVSSAVKSLTATLAAKAFLAEIVCEGDEVRFWKDGGSPTTAQGILLGPGERIYLWAVEITGFRAIRKTTDATLQVTYYEPRTGVRDYKE